MYIEIYEASVDEYYLESVTTPKPEIWSYISGKVRELVKNPTKITLAKTIESLYTMSDLRLINSKEYNRIEYWLMYFISSNYALKTRRTIELGGL